MKAQTMKQIGTALIVIGLAGAYYTIATMNNRGGAIALPALLGDGTEETQ